MHVIKRTFFLLYLIDSKHMPNFYFDYVYAIINVWKQAVYKLKPFKVVCDFSITFGIATNTTK